ncbi:WhiB family transcriptional regulator [Streptomyces sp. NPDC048489]|uniref:WhiB family transcriptional regulator n=1 Tax=Streptomyces sp. NPDC048489 TaxID=3154504 RepID=UPI003423818B
MTTTGAFPHQDNTLLNCATTDSEVFHDDAHAALARKLCEVCPLAQSFRSRARAHRQQGSWGGETTAQRATAGFTPRGWRGRGHQRENRRCGTPAAYHRHILAREKPCTSCKAAESRRRAGSTRRSRRRAMRND